MVEWPKLVANKVNKILSCLIVQIKLTVVFLSLLLSTTAQITHRKTILKSAPHDKWLASRPDRFAPKEFNGKLGGPPTFCLDVLEKANCLALQEI